MEEKQNQPPSSSSFLSKGVVEPVDAGTLDAIYLQLLLDLGLSDAHRGALAFRGLPDVAIDRGQYATLPNEGRSQIAARLAEQFGDLLLRAPGFFVREESGRGILTLAGAAGLLIPVRDLQGRIRAIKIRRDDNAAGMSKYVAMSSSFCGGASPGAPVHVPMGTPAKGAELADRYSGTVRITEGELKADVAFWLDAFPTLSFPGITNWRAVIPVLQAMGASTVRLAFDQEFTTKPHVAKALDDCAAGLIDSGFQIEFEHWQETYKGIDDALVAKAEIKVVGAAEARKAIADVVIAATGGDETPKISRGESWEPAGEGADHDERDQIPLGHTAFKPPPFDAFYPTIANAALAYGEAHNANPAMFALYALSIVAGCLGRSRVIRISESWFEPCAIFSCIIGDSTSKKSVMLRDAVSPALEIDAELDAKSERDFAEYQEALAAYEAWKPSKDGPPKPGRPIEPIDHVLLANDMTIEAVGKWQRMNPRGMLFAFEEIMEWFLGMGRYNNGDGSHEQRFWIGMFDGAIKSSLRTKNSRRTRFLTLGSVTGGMTPSDWAEVAAPRAFANGMLGRMLPIYPGRVSQTASTKAPPAAIVNAYRELVRAAAMLDREGSAGRAWNPVEMLFTPHAEKVWRDWLKMWNARIEDADGDIRTLLARMKSYCARFALISSVCGSIESHGPNVVEAEDVRNAARLAAWFAEEAQRVYAMGQLNPHEMKVARLLQKLRDRHGEAFPEREWHSITARTLSYSNPGFWGSTSHAAAFLDSLATDVEGKPGPLTRRGGHGGARYFLRDKP